MGHFLRLRLILFIALMAVSVGPVLFLGSWIKRPAFERELDAVREKHLLLARYVAGTLDRYARDVEVTFQLAIEMVLQGIDTTVLEPLWSALGFRHVCIIDWDGRVIHAIVPSRSKAPQRLPADLLALANEYARSDRVAFTPLAPGSGGKPLIHMTVRLSDGRLAVGAITTDFLIETQQAVSFGQKGHAAIVDQSGRVIAHPREDWRLAMKNLSALEPVRRMRAGGHGVISFYSPALDTDMIAGFSTVARAGWGIMVPQPMTELKQSVQGLLEATLQVTLLGALIAALLSWWLTGYLTRPLLAVTRAVGKVAQGKSAEPVVLGKCSPRELRTLTESFNSMLTEISRAEHQLQAGERRFRDFAETAADWFWETDADLRIVYLSERFEQVTEQPPAIVLGTELVELLLARTDDWRMQQGTLEAIQERRSFSRVELGWESKDGALRIQLLGGLPIFDRHGVFQGYRGTGRDVTEARRLSAQLGHQASHDYLTGLYNRREFELRVAQALEQLRRDEARHALCFIDLDQFKVVNDTCGHAAGDELLRQVGTVLQEHIRKGDVVARVGGDEFGILLSHCASAEAERVAEGLLRAIQDFRFTWEDKSFTLGASIGVVPVTSATPGLNRILQEADAACYLAKENGRNRIHLYRDNDQYQARRRGEMQWVHRINRALETRRIQVYLQEIAPLGEGCRERRHFEALVRMRTENGGIVTAGAFLPAAERYNLATRVDREVVSQVFDWLASEQANQDDSMYAINLSGQSLGDEDFLRFLLERLEQCRVCSGQICFEITETAAIANMAVAMRFFQELKQRGCRLALDDFGSGLSSFAYLKFLPVDYLKIDGAFVKGIIEDPVDCAIVRSINEMGHVLGKKTIAELVETRIVFERLRELGVDFAQGYYVGKPRPLDLDQAEATGSTTPGDFKSR